ncbi:hypothetical protein P7L78_21910 [Tistrella bauzanensis]|uniref:LamG-like jellyroll fold domain-containing protein n=1 Tax=Tistrella TaxID=171436 RepID=UPI0031F67163
MGYAINLGPASLSSDCPLLTDYISPVPVTGLRDVWRAGGLVTQAAGAVSAWAGIEGAVAVQTTGSRQPAWSATGIASGIPGITTDGTGHVLMTSITPPSAGYIVIAVKMPASVTGSAQTFVGSETDATHRLRLGTQGSKPAAAIGDVVYADLIGGSNLAAATRYVVGLAWAGGTASLRINGLEVDTASYSGGVGTAPFAIGANSTISSFAAATFAVVAIFDGALMSGQLDAIDAGMAVAIGL